MRATRSRSSQLTRMRYLAAGDGSNCGCLDRRHSSRLAVERHELDLESLAVGVNVNDRPDIASLQPLVGHSRGQNDAIVFADHAEGVLLIESQCSPRSSSINRFAVPRGRRMSGHPSNASPCSTGGRITPARYEFLEATLYFVMRHALACIEFRDAAFDLRDEYELLDRVVDRRVSWQLSQQFDDAIAREWFGHDRILRFVAITGREERPVAAWVGPNLGPRLFKRCKSFGNQHFPRPPQLAWRRGSLVPPPLLARVPAEKLRRGLALARLTASARRRVESSRPDQTNRYLPAWASAHAGSFCNEIATPERTQRVSVEYARSFGALASKACEELLQSSAFVFFYALDAHLVCDIRSRSQLAGQRPDLKRRER